MTAIAHDDWGSEYPGRTSESIFTYYNMPSQAACAQWVDTTETDCMMKIKARVYYTNSDALSFRFINSIYNDGLSVDENPVKLNVAPGWNHSLDDTLESVGHPSNPTSIDGYPSSFAVPYFRGGLTFGLGGAGVEESPTATVWGYELSTWYEVAFEGNDMELYDHSDNTTFADDRPASSFLISKILIESYNKIVYCASQRIGIAMSDIGAA